MTEHNQDDAGESRSHVVRVDVIIGDGPDHTALQLLGEWVGPYSLLLKGVQELPLELSLYIDGLKIEVESVRETTAGLEVVMRDRPTRRPSVRQ